LERSAPPCERIVTLRPDATVECADCGLLLPNDPRPGTIPTQPFYQVGPDVKVICSPSGAFVDGVE